MKVIHLIPYDGIGGVETAARTMLEANTGKIDFKLMLLAGTCLKSRVDRVLESSFRSPNNPFAHAYTAYRIIREHPDILVCSLWRTIIVGLIVKLFLRDTRVVCFLHSESLAHFVDKWLHKVFLFFCDAIWADSLNTLRARISNIKKYTRVISFVTFKSSTLRAATTPLSPRFAFWGRVNILKGLDRSICLINELKKIGYEAHYDIWGPDGGQQAFLVEQIGKLGLEKHVSFRGPVNREEIEQLSSKYSFYLQLSREEGMAMSVVEAMQYGLVPIVTPVGEIAKYCVDGVNGVVVDDVDNLEQIAKKLVHLLAKENEYRALQKSAQEYWFSKITYPEDFSAACIELHEFSNKRLR